MLLTGVGSAQVVELRPNLVPFPASELSIVTDVATGGPKLVFAATSWNNGTGAARIAGW